MRDKDGWNLTQKQREKYLQSVKMLYSTPSKGSVGIVAPRVSLEVLGLSHEKASGREEASQGPVHGSSPKVPRGTKPKHRKEWKEQADIYQWTQTQEVLRGFTMKFDNERRRTVVQAAVAKRMGLLAGTSDLFVARPSGRFCGLWLEVKQAREYTPSERRSETWKRQEEFQERMRSVGFACRFAFGAEDGIKIIRAYINLGIREVMSPYEASIPPDRDDR